MSTEFWRNIEDMVVAKDLSFIAPSWMNLAVTQLGQKEIAGSVDNPQILEYHKATSLKATADEVPWCSAFVNWCMKESGYPATNSAAARSWLKFGVGLRVPAFGCIVVLPRGDNPTQGHVGFFAGIDPDNKEHILILGGNQRDQVSVASFRKSSVLGYRWLV